MVTLPNADATCINLKERFGDRCRIEYEESYYAERGDHGRLEDPWLMLIPCQHGHICPWGGEILAACTDKRGPVAKKLVELPVTEMWQDGDDGVNVKFHVDHFDQVEEIIKPKRRRRLSPEQRERLIEAGWNHRFANNNGAQHAPGERRRTKGTGPDTLAVQQGKVAGKGSHEEKELT